MLRIRNLRNKYQKRLIRPLYAQTQATPYAAVLDDSFREDPTTLTLPTNAFTYKGGLVPGTVMTNLGEKVTVATGDDLGPGDPGADGAYYGAFGLLANFVGGELDDLGDESYVGVWRGPDSVFEILAPGFDDEGLSAAWDAAVIAGSGVAVPLTAGADGRLVYNATIGDRQVVALLIERPSASRIVVDLKV